MVVNFRNTFIYDNADRFISEYKGEKAEVHKFIRMAYKRHFELLRI
jgi:hypothetical protein